MLAFAIGWVMLGGGCPPVEPFVDQVFPSSGASGLPANTVVRVEPNIRDGSLDVMVTVTSAMGGYSGAAVIGDGDVYVFDPGVDLAPGTWSARITLDDGSDPVTSSVSFTTVAGTDVTAPEIPFEPTLEIGEYFDAPPTAPGCPDPPPVWRVTADWEDATDASPLLYATRGRLLSSSQVTVAGTPDATFSFEVFAIDVAGNTGAAPVATLELPGEPEAGDPGTGCSCSLAPTQSSAPAGIVLLLALATSAWRRRRGVPS